MEEIQVAAVETQTGNRDDGSSWTRYRIKDGNGHWYSTFDEAFVAILREGARARIQYETKVLGGGRSVKNLTAVEPVENGSVPAQYSHQRPDGEADWDKVALGKTRCALWNHFLAGQLAANLYAKAVSAKDGRDPMDYVIITGTRLVVHAEKDVFERPPGDSGIPFLGDGSNEGIEI